MPIQDAAAFALTGLMSRGGLSNWVFVFFVDRLVMIDVGMGPALKAGAAAGVLGQFGAAGVNVLRDLHYGPKQDGAGGLEAWSQALGVKAKRVTEHRLDELRRVRLHLKMTAHELFVTAADGPEAKFGLMNRSQVRSWETPLRERLGPKFDVSQNVPGWVS